MTQIKFAKAFYNYWKLVFVQGTGGLHSLPITIVRNANSVF